jgi:putative transposase
VLALARISGYCRRRRVSVSRFEQEAELKASRAAFPEYAAIHSHILQAVLARLDKTYQAFFRRIQRGEKAGFPRFKGRKRFHTFAFKELGNGATLDNGFLVLSKIGRIAIHWSRPIEGTPKTVTISKEADGWYVAISCAGVSTRPLPPPGQETGIGLGIEAFATLSDGTRIFSPGWYRKAEQALKTAQRRVSRRKKGSHRRRKAVNLLAKAHQKVRDSDRTSITRPPSRVRTTRSITRMCRSATWSGTTSAGWSAFLTILTFKAASAGKRVQAVDPAYTSQTCSGRGAMVSKGLSVRWHACPDCGMNLRRDHNAARNIQWRGQRLRGLVGASVGVNREPAGL